MLRKEAFKSKNHLSVKLEKIHKEKQKNKLTGTEAQQLAIMKEILYDQNQLQQVLSKSDTMMAVVKDLFGDDPKRFMGFPNVTTAPNGGDHNSLVAPITDIYTRTEKLSDSLMDQSALNDDLDTTSDSDDQIHCPHPISYESKINLQHFEDYLKEEKSKTTRLPAHEHSKTNVNNNMSRNIPEVNTSMDTHADAGKQGPACVLPLLKTLLDHSDRGQGDQLGLPDPSKLALLLGMLTAKPAADLRTPPKETQHLPSERTPPSAMNDTKKIKRSKKVLQSQNTSSESINTTSNVNDMRQVLQELENEMAEYENETGRYPQKAAHKTETFSGYTVTLVSAVSRLTRYLREMELRVQTESTLREHLTQDVCQLRTVIDALATDLIVTREEYQKLYWESKHYRDSTEAKLASANNQLVELQRLVTGSGKRSSIVSQTKEEQEKPSHQHQGHYESADMVCKQPATFQMSTPLQDDGSTQSDLESSIYHPLPTHLKSGPVPAAVLLSPPVRKTRVQSNAVSGRQPLQCQTSLVSQAASEGTSYSADPPRLTQTPPVMNTVSVPRPVPLVQSNLNFALASGLSVSQAAVNSSVSEQGVRTVNKVSTGHSVHSVPDAAKFGDSSQQQQELAVDEALNDPILQSLMQAQLAELNRQQEEARQRLLDLLDKQKLQQKFLQDQHDSDSALDSNRKQCTGWQSNMLKQPVSPPISPILERTEQTVKERNVAGSLSNIKLDAEPK
ncbi:unnamed protein product [Candidula unifasciata]|uniref:Spindle and centriole-associated protein 1 n=1 Tax=Candidula unifasciata TaxID=100452 RepID=A0A8S3Z167_9EUPU|nr:unnamed protein product [Candidula unifasciata]